MGNVDAVRADVKIELSQAVTIPKIEICIDARTPQKTEEEVRIATLGGADRIELCDNMIHSGTTPQKECIKIARELFTKPDGMIVMIRPRGGNFFFTRSEIDQMRKAIDVAAESGADGVALGALRRPEGDLCTEVISELITDAYSANLTVTLHRAFDAIPEKSKSKAIEWARTIGVNRILTSGTPWGINDGPTHNLYNLKELSILANGHIEIVASGGINLVCVKEIVTTLSNLPSPFSLHIFSGVRVKNSLDINRIYQIREKLTNVTL